MAGSGCQMTFDVRPGAGHRIGRPVQLAAVNLEHVPEAVEDLERCGHIISLRHRSKSLGIVEQYFFAASLDQKRWQA